MLKPYPSYGPAPRTMNKTLRYIIYAALFIIPFLALYIDNTLYFPFISGKNFAFRILVEIAAAAWVLLALADKKYRPQFSWTLILYGAFTAWMAVADALAVNPHKAFWSNFERMDGWVTIIHLFLFLLVAGSVFTADRLWRPWWLTFLGAQFLVSCYGLLQFFHLAAIHQGSTRLDASLGNAEYFAGYLLFGIAVALWLAFDTKEKRQRWLRYGLFALAALDAFMLVETGTRGTFIGFLVALVAGALLWMFQSGKRGRQGALVALAGLVLVAGAFLSIRNSAFIAKDPILSRFASISLSDATPRFAIWRMALRGVAERPVFGWGQDGFNYVFNKYYDPVLYGQEPWFDRAHNIYLDWASAGGIPALLLFLAAFASAIMALYRGSASRAERVMFIAALTAYAVQGLVVFDNLFTYIPLIAFLGLAHAASARPWPAFQKPKELPEAALTAIGLPVAFVALVAVIWLVNVPTIVSGKDLLQAVSPGADLSYRYDDFKQAIAQNGFAHQEVREQLLQFAASVDQTPAVPNAVKSDVTTYAVDQMRQELAIAPQDARLHLQLAMLLRAAGDFADSQKESALARQSAPTKQGVIIEQGIEALQAGDVKAAERYFDQAYALNASSDELAAYAGSGHILAGDLAGGKAILMQRYGTTTIANQNIVLLAYFQTKDWNDLIAVLTARAQASNDVNAWLQVAAALQQAGRPAEAQQLVRTLLVQHPEAASQIQAALSGKPAAAP